MKTETALPKKKAAVQTIDELVGRYELSNVAEGKSPKTIAWYRDMLTLFSCFLKTKQYPSDSSGFNIDTVREYIIYLRHKPKFQGHPYNPAQAKSVSPKTVQCHVRALKAFSSWLYAEGYTIENRLKNLKIPKAPVVVVEPLTPEEIKKVTASINKKSPTGTRNYAIFVTLLDTGLRASEAAGITLGNLNLASTDSSRLWERAPKNG